MYLTTCTIVQYTCLGAELESSRTSLASRTSSRTHFEVLGLGLEASSPRKLPRPRLEDSTIFEPLEFRWKTPETLRKICKDVFLVSSSRDRLKKFFWRPFSFEKIFWRFFFEIAWKKFWRSFFWEHLRLCPWSLALASRGSVLGLGHEPCVLDSTSAYDLTIFPSFPVDFLTSLLMQICGFIKATKQK